MYKDTIRTIELKEEDRIYLLMILEQVIEEKENFKEDESDERFIEQLKSIRKNIMFYKN